MGRKKRARKPAKKKKNQSLLRSVILLIFCSALLYGAWFFFLDRGTVEDEPLAGEELPEPEEDLPEIEAETEEPEVTAEEPEPESVPGVNPGAGEAILAVIADGDYLLALITKETTLKSSYAPSDLERIPEYMYPARELLLRAEALKNLEDLWQAAYEDGITLTIISAYRSYSYQQTLFQNYAASYGEQAANRFSARAGQSEHQLGTTVDFGGTNVDLKAAFADTDQGRWLAENAHKYGFAMSYPEGREAVTGYIFEPWHYRYIGLEAAAEWFTSGLSLKEFLQLKPQDFE